MNNISDDIDTIIKNAIVNYDGGYVCGNHFEALLSFGELVDRLSIINFKLYKLKDEVMDRPADEKFCAWAAVEDVKLVEERSRLKRCIDEKLISITQRVQDGDKTGGFNPEIKKYGKK
jgi:hypothetical protein